MKRIKIWLAYFFGTPRTLQEFIVSVDLSNVWRQHLVWSKKNGDDLKKIVTERFSSSTVFLSLLFSSEMAVLYSPSDPGKDLRAALKGRDTDTTAYWLGIAVCFGIFFSVSALVANFTAMAVFSSLSKQNAPIVLRSTLGIYSAQLPSRLVTGAIYLFFTVVCLSWWVIMAPAAAVTLVVLALWQLLHIVNTYSAMGRVIMDSGAMSDLAIMDPEEEEKLNPHELSEVLIKRVILAQKSKVSVNDQYKFDYQTMLNEAQDGKIDFPLSRSELDHRASVFMLRRSKMGHGTRHLGVGMLGSLASTASAVPGGVQSSLASVGSAVSNLPGNVVNVASAVPGGVRNVASGAVDAATGAATGVANVASNIPRMLPGGISSRGPTMPSVTEASGEMKMAEEEGEQVQEEGVEVQEEIPQEFMEIPVETVSEQDDGF